MDNLVPTFVDMRVPGQGSGLSPASQVLYDAPFPTAKVTIDDMLAGIGHQA